jgi:hypothetical protein
MYYNMHASLALYYYVFIECITIYLCTCILFLLWNKYSGNLKRVYNIVLKRVLIAQINKTITYVYLF